MAVNIDVKTIIEDATDPPHRRTAALVAAGLRAHAGQRRLFVSSFDPSLLKYLQECKDTLPGIPLGLITWLRFPAWHAIPAAVNLGLDAICLHTGISDWASRSPSVEYPAATIIEAAHRAGLEVLAWYPTRRTRWNSPPPGWTRCRSTTSPASWPPSPQWRGYPERRTHCSPSTT